MKYFTFSCRDISSDNGYAEVVVYALSILVANKRLKEHLREMGREDLLADMKLKRVMPDDINIIYSSVETNAK
jgi:hypothetical protein